MRYTEKIKEQVNGLVSNRSLSLLFIFVIGIILLGGTYSYWIWETDEFSRTAVSFTATGTLSCSADGGGDITVGSTSLIPASCTNKEHVIRRVITTSVNNLGSSATSLSMWLNVNTLGSYLANNSDFKYTLSTSDSCTSDIIASGDFGDVTVGSTLSLVDEEKYPASKETGTYYLYMWLDKRETTIPPDNLEARTMNLSLGGTCAEVDTIVVEPAVPVLDTAGMIPVTIDNSGNVKTISATDENWYNYEEKQWANAILVTEGSRAKYLNKKNTPVTKSDILAYYVWIPKYSYKMNSSSGQGNESEISISWNYNESGYVPHPAFTFNEDMTGFWVGKFETTGTAEQPTILNGVSPLVSQKISEQFTSSLLFAGGTFDDTNRTITFANSPTYGLSNTTDSHMMKNSEWGAVAYLSHSQYGTCTDGVCQEIRHNNYYYGSLQTGCGAATANASQSATCSLAYGNGRSEYPQSTTGNITGVFDMAGGTHEYVMGNYNNTYNSTYWTLSNLPPTKYYDVYTTEAACTTETCGGHALTETKKWYGDNASFVSSSTPWFLRGGNYSNGAVAGAFNSRSTNGIANSNGTWRSVLAVG